MATLWTELLALHGHIADPQLLARLDRAPSDQAGPRGKRGGTRSTVGLPGPLGAIAGARRTQAAAIRESRHDDEPWPAGG